MKIKTSNRLRLLALIVICLLAWPYPQQAQELSGAGNDERLASAMPFVLTVKGWIVDLQMTGGNCHLRFVPAGTKDTLSIFSFASNPYLVSAKSRDTTLQRVEVTLENGAYYQLDICPLAIKAYMEAGHYGITDKVDYGLVDGAGAFYYRYLTILDILENSASFSFDRQAPAPLLKAGIDEGTLLFPKRPIIIPVNGAARSEQPHRPLTDFYLSLFKGVTPVKAFPFLFEMIPDSEIAFHQHLLPEGDQAPASGITLDSLHTRGVRLIDNTAIILVLVDAACNRLVIWCTPSWKVTRAEPIKW